jgi:hypothetical protein
MTPVRPGLPRLLDRQLALMLEIEATSRDLVAEARPHGEAVVDLVRRLLAVGAIVAGELRRARSEGRQ